MPWYDEADLECMDVDILLRLDEGGSDRPVAGGDRFRIAAAQRLPVTLKLVIAVNEM